MTISASTLLIGEVLGDRATGVRREPAGGAHARPLLPDVAVAPAARREFYGRLARRLSVLFPVPGADRDDRAGRRRPTVPPGAGGRGGRSLLLPAGARPVPDRRHPRPG